MEPNRYEEMLFHLTTLKDTDHFLVLPCNVAGCSGVQMFLSARCSILKCPMNGTGGPFFRLVKKEQ